MSVGPRTGPGPPIFVGLKLKPGVVSKEEKWPEVPLKMRRNEENCYSFNGQREINIFTAKRL